MNIFTVSFSGLNSDFNRINKSNSNKSRNRNNNKDVYISSCKTSKKNKKRVPLPIVTFVLGLLVNTGISNIGKDTPNKPNQIVIPFNNDTSITEIADMYDTNEEILLSANDVENIEDIFELDELKIPTTYDYIQDKISALKDDLYSSKLTDEKRTELQNEIKALENKHNLQKNIANAYTDGKFVYFAVNVTEDAPDGIVPRSKSGINVEIFKNIFDIKDAAIRRNNKLEHGWTKPAKPEYKSEPDYTIAFLNNGRVIKVPMSAIQQDKIDLNGFMEE